ncbi:NB-ARC domain-containing protein [Streptomyces sp. LP11]|uniref:NB-ARC domain-containing protein n=1 Tax=Streptomyces pyxinicus TaxID=2970331 RepID=A0ABT2AWF5_9ACTN|nr:BTAD domain-containing putative transcriptional regulator [Streptomyces sp. LP11]MCS0600033.1 NB-ARC domain-containing protein [Streptomyces sp. LP11]
MDREVAEEGVRFAVLGPVRVWRGGQELDLGGPQNRAFLAVLLLRAGQPVAVSEIVDALWGPHPPRSAVNVVRRQVGALRRLLEPGLPPRAAGRWLTRDAGGYRLRADDDSLDLLRFRGLRERAAGVVEESPARALELLTRALSLWAGPVASGTAPDVRARLVPGALRREHLAALQEAADAALRAGVPHAVVPGLQQAAADHPLDEPLLARLMLALAAAGRRSEALATYEAARRRLADELGMDPGRELREAHREALLDAAPAPAGEAAGVPLREASGPYPLTVPAQLPHDLGTFTGRRAELAEALGLSGGDGQHTGTVVINAIGGMAGVGKTTLAVHWAHQVADRYPDGQLYVNLRGFDPSGVVTDPGEAVRGFLDALGVPPEQIPPGLDAQAALYRGVLSGRRVLVLLDNARDADQVRPLLAGAPGCLTIVTSRSELTGLVAAHGARSLTLRPFDADQARELLAGRLGAERIAAEPRAADEIATLCAGLPLALACVAARAAIHPHFPLQAVAGELREAHGSLDAFTRSDTSVDVGTVFSWSSRAVSPDANRLFRLLALHPGPDFSVPAAAALAGLPPRQARHALAELSGVHLVNENPPGRYGLHDLLRAHAAELLDARETEAERQAAVDRLFAYYLYGVYAGAAVLAPNDDPVPIPPPAAGTPAETFADDHRALAWVTAEHPVLLAVIDAAAASGRDRLACLLAWSLEPYFDRRGHWHDGVTAQRTAFDAALRLGDPVWEARGLRGLARAEARLGLLGRAGPRLDRALELFAEAGDDIGRAETHRSLGWMSEQQGDLAGALRHNQLALDLFRAAGHRAAQGSVLNSVGWYHALLGEYRQALTHCFEALTVLQEQGDRYGQAATWDSIAYAYHQLGRHPHALLGYRNALALYRDLGVPYLEAESLLRIGDTHLATGDHEGARAAWRQAHALLVGLGHPDADRVADRIRTGTPVRGAV